MRRPFRRRGPLPRRGSRPVPRVVRKALQRAQQLQRTGDFQGAAAIYDRLAEGAYKRRMIRPGVQMGLAAARAYLKAGELALAQKRTLRVLRFMLEHQLPPDRVRPLVDRLIQALEAQDQAEARRFRNAVDALLNEHHLTLDGLSRPQAAPTAKRTLPGQCPSCYAPLHPDDVVWVADDRVQCAYCGNIVVAG